MSFLNRLSKISALIFLLSVLVSMQACSQNVDLNMTGTKRDVALIVKMRDSVYWKTVRLGAETAAKEFDVNINLYAPEDEEDVDGQMKLVNQALEKKPDGLILAAANYKLLSGAAGKACDMGIPVIAIDSDVDEKRVRSFIATDNKEAGRKAGNKLIEIAGEKCRIAVISFGKGSRNAEQREEGLFSVIARCPQAKVVSKEYCLSDTNLASDLAGKIISDYGEIDAIVALSEIASIGAAEAVQKMNLENRIRIIAFDSAPEEIRYLDNGVIHALIVQNPFNMGYLGVKYAVDAMNGKPIHKRIDTGSKVVDKSSMFMTENQKLLFPFVK